MNQMSSRKVAVATATFVCATLLSFSSSEQRGVSLSVESAQARVGNPLSAGSVAGVARRHNRRAAYGYGGYGRGYYGHPVARGAAVAAGAAAVGATGWGWNQPYGGGWGWNQPYGGGYANQSYVTGRPTLVPRYYGGTGGAYAAAPQPYQASVYGQGGPYTAPGTCYVDCANYYRNLRESGYNPKNYLTPAGTVKQTAY